jgi:hypothetical protein
MPEPWAEIITSHPTHRHQPNGGTHEHTFEDWEYGFPVKETDLWQDEGGMG